MLMLKVCVGVIFNFFLKSNIQVQREQLLTAASGSYTVNTPAYPAPRWWNRTTLTPQEFFVHCSLGVTVFTRIFTGWGASSPSVRRLRELLWGFSPRAGKEGPHDSAPCCQANGRMLPPRGCRGEWTLPSRSLLPTLPTFYGASCASPYLKWPALCP